MNLLLVSALLYKDLENVEKAEVLLSLIIIRLLGGYMIF